MRPVDGEGAQAAGLGRRALALIYEALLLAALLLAGSLPFVMLLHDSDTAWVRPLYQFYLIALAGVYFVWHWQRGGQTLPMKTWRLRLVARDGAPLTPGQALTR